mgnify:CR=1 FL=1
MLLAYSLAGFIGAHTAYIAICLYILVEFQFHLEGYLLSFFFLFSLYFYSIWKETLAETRQFWFLKSKGLV